MEEIFFHNLHQVGRTRAILEYRRPRNRKLLTSEHNQPLINRLVRTINRAYFGRYISKRFIGRVALLLEGLAQEGNALAAYWLATINWEGWGVPTNPEKALELFHLAAEHGNRVAQYNLGVAYDNGLGITKNQATAFGYFFESAKQGETEAMHSVGSMYYWGHGVVQNYSRASYWYRKSAKRGFATAMCDLGRCYQRGVGVKKDLQKAINWFTKAVKAGDVRAKTWLGLAYTCLPDPKWKLARYWLEQASEQEQVHAMYLLGAWAESGWNGNENLADAQFWYSHAAELGHTRAALCLAELKGENF
ncbi:tetratricopeptide repeat protein [Hymenobacter saemangeumensis]|uniref:tetratricopeptide repeat protein n=1 Tax=Hymenobacter saemangeumensis TaxID=1084522 RepID=UPI0031E63631